MLVTSTVSNQHNCIYNVVDPISYGIKRTIEVITDPYKLANKTVSFIRATKNVVAVFVYISNGLSGYFSYLDPIKVVQVPLYTRKVYLATTKLFTADNWQSRTIHGFTVYKYSKKVLSGVTAGLKFAQNLNLLGSSALNWTTVTGYIFLPVSFVSMGLNINLTKKQAILLYDFHAHANLEKKGILKACTYFVENRKRFQDVKVIPKNKDFDVKVAKLVEKLKIGTGEEEAKKLLSNIKWRIGSCLLISGIKSVLKVASCTVTILGFTSVVGVLPAVILDLCFSIGSLSLFVAAKYVHSRPLIQN